MRHELRHRTLSDFRSKTDSTCVVSCFCLIPYSVFSVTPNPYRMYTTSASDFRKALHADRYTQSQHLNDIGLHLEKSREIRPRFSVTCFVTCFLPLINPGASSIIGTLARFRHNRRQNPSRQFICTFLSLSKTGTAVGGVWNPVICGFAFCKAVFYSGESAFKRIRIRKNHDSGESA